MTGVETATRAVVRRAGEGSHQWFLGGGTWTWKLMGADTNGGLSVVEVVMDEGKRTPLHTHPIAESHWLLEGRVRYRIDEDDVEVGPGDLVMVQAGVPHAFLVLTEHARMLTMQESDACEAFYLGASEPLEGSARQTDFARIAESGRRNGGIDIVGPPPW